MEWHNIKIYKVSKNVKKYSKKVKTSFKHFRKGRTRRGYQKKSIGYGFYAFLGGDFRGLKNIS